MKKRLNYRALLKNWMQFYSLTAEAAEKMFSSIWTRVQASIKKPEEKDDETHVE